jgi:hypothetical protein
MQQAEVSNSHLKEYSGAQKMYTHRSAAIFFDCPAIGYSGFFYCEKINTKKA